MKLAKEMADQNAEKEEVEPSAQDHLNFLTEEEVVVQIHQISSEAEAVEVQTGQEEVAAVVDHRGDDYSEEEGV